jgi:hypothetical protein
VVADGDAEVVADGDGQGVGEALVVTVAAGLADVVGDGFGVGVGVGVALALAVAEAEGVGVAAGAQIPLGIADGASSVWLPPVLVLLPPSSKSAAGTTSRPRMTVITKASAPHSWSQKARDELRIRARRPVRAEACCAY